MSDELGQVTYWVTTPNDGRVIIHSPPGLVSDGYHTFDELYAHRCQLFMLLLLWGFTFGLPHGSVFKTRKNDKGEEWPGWFIAGANTQYGQLTYHLPIELWDRLPIPELERNIGYDGHTAADVLERLNKWVDAWGVNYQ